MAAMDVYIDQLLAEMQMPEPAQKVVKHILDEPLSEQWRGAYLSPVSKQISTSTPTSHVEGPGE